MSADNISAVTLTETLSRTADGGVDVVVWLLLDWPRIPPQGLSVLLGRDGVFESERGSEQER